MHPKLLHASCHQTSSSQNVIWEVGKKRSCSNIEYPNFVLRPACRERVEIPSNKPFITFQGAGRSVTFITGNSAARDWKREFSSAQGTYHSCVVGVNADHFIARNISFQVCSFFCIYANFDTPLDDPPSIEKFAAASFEHMFIHSSYTMCCMGLGSSTPSQGFESCYRTTIFRYWS